MSRRKKTSPLTPIRGHHNEILAYLDQADRAAAGQGDQPPQVYTASARIELNEARRALDDAESARSDIVSMILTPIVTVSAAMAVVGTGFAVLAGGVYLMRLASGSW